MITRNAHQAKKMYPISFSLFTLIFPEVYATLLFPLVGIWNSLLMGYEMSHSLEVAMLWNQKRLEKKGSSKNSPSRGLCPASPQMKIPFLTRSLLTLVIKTDLGESHFFTLFFLLLAQYWNKLNTNTTFKLIKIEFMEKLASI